MDKTRGFTLIEMLVVLLITSMVVGLLFQAMSQLLVVQRRAGEIIAKSQQGVMIEDWFRLSLQGLQPDYDSGNHKFVGLQRQMKGLTTNPLTADYGTIVPFSWAIAYDAERQYSSLKYNDGRVETPVLTWPGDSGRFVYVDSRGEAHDTWPPPLGKKWTQLPAVIRFETKEVAGSDEGERWIIVAVPRGPQQPPFRARDILGSK